MPDKLIPVKLIRTDGAEEVHEVGDHILGDWISRMLGNVLCDVVNLRDGRFLYVDDTGMVDGKPVNAKATELYHSVCKPGTTHQIHGDVAVVTES